MLKEILRFLVDVPIEIYGIIFIIVLVSSVIGVVQPKLFATQVTPSEECFYGWFGTLNNCYNNRCDENTLTCMKSEEGEYCNESDDCTSSLICFDTECQTGNLGSPCQKDSDCNNLVCSIAPQCGVCSSGDLNAPCCSNSSCQTNGLTCIDNNCSPLSPLNGRCNDNEDCETQNTACYKYTCQARSELCEFCNNISLTGNPTFPFSGGQFFWGAGWFLLIVGIFIGSVDVNLRKGTFGMAILGGLFIVGYYMYCAGIIC